MGQQLLTRYGLVTREVAAAENLPGGFTAIHDVFRTLEESGRIRRGYFVSGVGAMQFAAPAAVDLLRALRTPSEAAEVAVLAATDPANPYGALVKWPEAPEGSGGRGPTRSVGARVVLVDGHLAAWIARGLRSLLVWLPEHEPDRSRHAEALARVLPMTGTDREQRAASVVLTEINGGPALDAPIRPFLEAAGFVAARRHAGVDRPGDAAGAASRSLAGHAGRPRRTAGDCRRRHRADHVAEATDLARVMPHAACLMPHASCLMPHASCRREKREGRREKGEGPRPKATRIP